MEPCKLTAAQAVAQMRDGRLSCEALVRSCLERIAARDPLVRAWLHVDPERAIRDARELDKCPSRGVLHGLPIGVKDVIDTADYPTTQNSAIYAGLQVGRDAACVAIARGRGALVLGKTDTVEFASSGRKALTRNPHNPAHTPGGSSSGSGAAVADFMVPLAFGTQTGGSVIRPAAFTGIYAMKPSWNLVSREGARMSSPTLDTIGWYGRSVADLALMGEAMGLKPAGTPPAVQGLRVGVCRSPVWKHIEPSGEAALAAAAARLAAAGARVTDLALPALFDGVSQAQNIIASREGGASFMPEYVTARAQLSDELSAKVENREGLSDEALLAAYATADAARPVFDRLFGTDLDVVLTPASPGEAPKGLHTTGNAIFNRMWTLLHVPCVAIPAGRGVLGLPVGLQLVGPRLSDAKLLALAAVLAPVIDVEAASGA
jgi:Asp-tRNA(Asn)/Glu-tRNA(Gln) amidotransferase A subunit family amidase